VQGGASGNLNTNAATVGGRVFVNGNEPILDAAFDTNGVAHLFLCGHPGGSYRIEARTNLDASAVWTLDQRVPLTAVP
jgi:hypothetical protein